MIPISSIESGRGGGVGISEKLELLILLKTLLIHVFYPHTDTSPADERDHICTLPPRCDKRQGFEFADVTARYWTIWIVENFLSTRFAVRVSTAFAVVLLWHKNHRLRSVTANLQAKQTMVIYNGYGTP